MRDGTRNGIEVFRLAEEDDIPVALPVFPDGAMVRVDGYRQSWRYFSVQYHAVAKLLQLPRQRMAVVEANPVEDSVGLHFRLGDYKKYPAYHPIQTTAYYTRALAYIAKKTGKTGIGRKLKRF